MPIEYINRRGKPFYLHQHKTKTAKLSYFFSGDKEGCLADSIPDEFEIYENPNAQVFLRRIPRKLITDEEIATVEKEINRHARLKYYRVDVKKDTINVFEPDQNLDSLSELFGFFPRAKLVNTEELINKFTTYSAVLRFVLRDKAKRLFVPERFCYLGDIDDWIDLGKPDNLAKIVKKYVKHLGRDSLYEFF